MEPVNVPLLEKVRDLILATPRSINMDKWLDVDMQEDETACGTTACIAGHVLLCSGFHVKNHYFADQNGHIMSFERVPKEAALLIGGEAPEGSHPLFWQHRWPGDFQERLWRAEGPKEYAEIVAEVIDNYIANPWPVRRD